VPEFRALTGKLLIPNLLVGFYPLNIEIMHSKVNSLAQLTVKISPAEG